MKAEKVFYLLSALPMGIPTCLLFTGLQFTLAPSLLMLKQIWLHMIADRIWKRLLKIEHLLEMD